MKGTFQRKDHGTLLKFIVAFSPSPPPRTYATVSQGLYFLSSLKDVWGLMVCSYQCNVNGIDAYSFWTKEPNKKRVIALLYFLINI